MDTHGLEAAVDMFFSAWSDRDQGTLRDLWLTSDPACSYLPATSPRRLVGEAAVTAFMMDRLKSFQTIRMRPRNVHVRRLAADLGSLFAEVDWALQENAASVAVGGTLRVCAVLRRADDRWLFCHYAEAPLAPLVELRRFYQKIAADGHEAPA